MICPSAPAVVYGPTTQTSATQLVFSTLSAWALTVKKTTALFQPATRNVLSMANGVPCPHPALCRNCGKAHAANSPCCQFWQHRFDQSWIMAQYLREGGSRGPSFLHAHPLTRETSTHRKSAAASHSHGGGEEAITDEEES